MSGRVGWTGGIAALLALLTMTLTSGVGHARGLNNSIMALTIHGVQVANVTDSGFTVAWVTDTSIPGSGAVGYGLSPSTASSQQSELAPPPGAHGDIHVVQVSNVLASTTYYFAVKIANITDNNGGQYYTVKTGPVLTGQATNHTVSGTVTLSDGHSPAPGVLITLKVLDNVNLNGTTSTISANESAVTNATGVWSIVLTPRTSDNNNIFNYTIDGSNDFIQYSVEGGALGEGTLQTVSLRLDPNYHLAVPTISLTASVANDTPVPTATPTFTPTFTPSVTWTPTTTPTAALMVVAPTPTSQASLAVAAESIAPTDTPAVAIGPVFLSPTPSETAVIDVPGVPTIVEELPTAPPILPPAPPPSAMAPPPSATATPTSIGVAGPLTPTPVPTQPADLGQPTTVLTPLFPFRGTPLPLGIANVQTGSDPSGTPLVTPSVSATPTSGSAAGVTGTTGASDTLPPVAKTLFATGFLVMVLGIILVSIGVSRGWRSS